MVDYKVPMEVTPPATKRNNSNQGVAFAETEDWKKDVTCFGCGKKGHRIAVCKKITEEERHKVGTSGRGGSMGRRMTHPRP